jgi:DNA-binding transcriptional regulator YiaG
MSVSTTSHVTSPHVPCCAPLGHAERDLLMKQSFYSERDYAFGQAMLSLRTAIGLTQAGLARMLRVSRKAIGQWEAGETYPKAEHLKALLAFAVRQQAFAAGREEEEIRGCSHTASTRFA